MQIPLKCITVVSTIKCLNFVRRKPIKTSKNNSGSQHGSSNGAMKGANKIAKPLSYDNYSTDTSSQFSADIVEVAGKGL